MADSTDAEFPSPEKEPVPGTGGDQERLREAIRLHKKGDLSEAIGWFRQVLARNPDHVEALYELAFASYDSRDYPTALRLAWEGMAYRSPYLASFYCLAGNSLDRLGHPGKAERTLRAGLAHQPLDSLLHYHLAILQAGQGWSKEARRSLKTALFCNPEHGAAHLALARLWFADGMRVPAILALIRYLALEPLGERFDDAFGMLYQILEQLVRPSAGQTGGTVEILYSVSPPGDEGDFRTRELSLAMAWAAKSTGPNAGRSLEEKLAETLASFFAILGQLESPGPAGFVESYYQPFYIEMNQLELVEPCLYHILQGTGSPNVNRWRDEHPDRLSDFLSWMQRFPWSAAPDR